MIGCPDGLCFLCVAVRTNYPDTAYHGVWLGGLLVWLCRRCVPATDAERRIVREHLRPYALLDVV